MPHVTDDQVSDWMNVDFAAPQRTRILQLIATAERYVGMRAGWDFYDATDPDGNQSRAWVEVVCRVAEKMFLNDTIGRRKHLAGPYQTERNADYSYTLAPNVAGRDLMDDPQISALIAYWQAAEPVGAFMETEGPSANGPGKYDPLWYAGAGHLEGDETDLSRLVLPFAE